MSSQPAPDQLSQAQTANATAPGVSGRGIESGGARTPETLQALIDQVASINAYIVPDGETSARTVRSNSNGGATIGIKCRAALRRFEIELERPTATGVRAANNLGEIVGRVEMRWMFIPNSFAARPDVEPPPTQLDPTRSQRFAIQEMTFSFGDGRDGFRSFGAGRTFPVAAGGLSRLSVAAIGDITQGFGKFEGHEGNFTLCGEISQEGGFVGHIIGRIVDERGDLRTRESLPASSEGGKRPDSDYAYLMWIAQKGKGAGQENRPSLTPDGQLRGLNIPMELKRGRFNFDARGSEGFRATELQVGEVIGLEEGYGRGSQPGASPVGSALNPFQFEGVARYSFDDKPGEHVGAIITNVLEGRRFDYRLKGVSDVAWRFGFFGPIIYGTGCFRDMEGIFYGASNSLFRPPPGDHIITHCYFARIYDPRGKLRISKL